MDLIVFGKIALSIFFVLFEVFIFHKRNFIQRLAEKYSALFFFGVFCIFRLIPFLLIYIVFQFDTTSDVPIFYDSAKMAIEGNFVYRDFQTSYSPLFPYLIGLIVPFWQSSKSIVLILILLEAIFVWACTNLFHLNKPHFKSLVYYSLPSTFIFSILGGQEDILMWGFLSLLILMYLKNRNVILVGIIGGLVLLLTKFIFILILPGIVFYFKGFKEQCKVLLGLASIGIPTFVILYHYSHWGFLWPLTEANVPRNPNLWSFFHTVSGGLSPYGPRYLNWLGLAFIEILLSYVILKYRNTISFESFLPAAFVLVYIWLMLVQQSSYANYSYAYLLPLVFMLNWESTKEFYFFLAINFFFAVQPAIWWRNGLVNIQGLHELTEPLKLVLFVMEVFLIGGMIWMMQKVFGHLIMLNHSKK